MTNSSESGSSSPSGRPGALEGIVPPGPRQKRDHEIGWRPWSREALEEAEREGKLILLDISAKWCHWCHVMDETSYSEPANIELINRHFIPIRVDGDERPDVQDRYLHSGWPTTAILLPSGEVLSAQSYVPPRALYMWLSEVKRLWEERREEILTRVREAAHASPATGPSPPAEGKGKEGDLMGMVPALVGAVRGALDRAYGGLGSPPKFPLPGAYELYLWAAWADRQLVEEARLALDGLLRLQDPVFGGFFRYSTDAAFSRPHYEKLLIDQARLIQLYSRAHLLLGEEAYARAVEQTLAYLDRFLAHPEWGYMNSQDADLGSHDPQADFVPGEDYFPLGEEERLRLGVPAVDQNRYTGPNGELALALVEAGMALGGPALILRGGELGRRLLGEVFNPDSGLSHTLTGEGPHDLFKDYLGMLAASVAVAATDASKEEVTLVGALADRMVMVLLDQERSLFALGGLPELGGEDGRPKGPHPVMENIRAARLLARLGHLLEMRRLRNLSRRLLRALAPVIPAYSFHAGEYALALVEAERYPLTLHLVSPLPDLGALLEEERLVSLWQVARASPTPAMALLFHSARQEVKNDDGSTTLGKRFLSLTFKAGDSPTAWVCTHGQCSSPLVAPDELAPVMERLARGEREWLGEVLEGGG